MIKKLIIISISVLFLSTAFSDNINHMNLRRGLYFALEGGASKNDNENIHAASESLFGIPSDISYRIAFGYRFNKNFAVESSYLSIISIPEHYNENTSGGSVYWKTLRKTNISGPEVRAKLIFPIDERVLVYAFGGAAYISQEIIRKDIIWPAYIIPTDYHNKSTKMLPEFGGGLSVNLFSPSFAIYGAYTDVLGSGDIENSTIWSFGFFWTFSHT